MNKYYNICLGKIIKCQSHDDDNDALEKLCACMSVSASCVGGDLPIVVQLHVLFIYVQLMQLKQHVTIRGI